MAEAEAAAKADLITSCDEKGVIRTVSDTPPTHYAVKLEGFSLLLQNNVEKYKSAEFEAGGYKWKLILYPKGHKSRDGNDNISVYLKVSKSSLPHLWSNVHAIFRVFLLDQNKDNYYTLQVANGRRFHKTKLKWGFDQFMRLENFKDPSNGYLVNDTCVFGAEIHVYKETCIGEHLVMAKKANSYKHTWKIESFSAIATKDVFESMPFYCGNWRWKITFYPKGNNTGKGSHISIFLALADPKGFPNSSQIYVDSTIRMIDQLHATHASAKFDRWFRSSSPNYGFFKFISLTDFNTASKGFLLNDSCIIEAEVIVHGVTTAL